MNAVLSINSVYRAFGSVRALDDVSLDVDRGERVALLGPNGSGKTTLFNVVTGVLRPHSGSVRFGSTDITGWRIHKLARHGLVRTFQHAVVFSGLTVRESVRVSVGRAEPNADIDRRANDLIDSCGLDGVADVAGGDLAYGMARRLNVAIGLAARPQVLMLDEPAAGLNDAESSELAALLRRANDEGITLVVVDHDMDFIDGVCERAVVLSAGRVLASGTFEQIRADSDVRRVYLGERG